MRPHTTTTVRHHARTRLAAFTGAAAAAVLLLGPAPAGADPASTGATSAAAATTSTTSTTAFAPVSVADYYADAEGLSGDALKDAVHTIISDQDVLSYDEVWDALKDTDEDPANTSNVILLYSGDSRSKSLNGGSTGDWNREHTWAKSHGDFGEARGPGTDVHHLRPSDVSVNSRRGNLDFDEGGSAVPGCSGCTADSDSFEPRDADKGDVARMILYMAVRYEGGDGFADLEPNESVGNGSAPYIGKLSVLRAWNEQDPPSAFERARNEAIYTTWQHNRNPFVDHPEWVDSIWP